VILLALTIAYLVVHFTLYVVVFRYRPAFGRERVIFRYHALPAVVLTLVLAVSVILARDSTTLAAAFLAISLQGLYSLSFLELWALADGGYSLQILERIATTHSAVDTRGMQEIGATKRSERLKSALDMGLIKSHGGKFSLTRRGSRIASAYATMLWVVNATLE
jgi:hypothetical protein